MPDLTLEQAARDVLASIDAAMAGEDLFGETHSDAFARLREVLGRSDVQPGAKTVAWRALWEHAAPASNAANDARDLSMVLTRALGTHDVGFGPDELAALYTVAGMVTDKATEAADKADAVCRVVDPPGGKDGCAP